ncbi:MAG: acyl transferase [Sphingobacteriaceae bacterium]|nr:acyl transferase [Sphingobacteriaceae bacterium]
MISPEQIFSIQSEHDFEALALKIFGYQAKENAIYSTFTQALGVNSEAINDISQIPFLPIEFFKSHTIKSGGGHPEVIFTSSGTTGAPQSRHPVMDLSLYIKSFGKGFSHFYGDIKDYTILALLPSYLEREGSSLIYMVDALIKESNNSESGYFLYNHDELHLMLHRLKAEKRKVILIGVTYALLDFAEAYKIDFPELIIMETGGMKGKRKELIREELHELLCAGFGVSNIHSEYGMTELLSQGYSKGGGKFNCPPWMKILIRDTNDPLSLLNTGKTGGINVIDLANLHSCSFLSTQDLGKLNSDGSFNILGRFDNSDIRGCNLLIQ